MSEKIVVGMSGGVDSAVSALLLKEKGFDVECVFMKNWEEDSEYCTTEQDYKDALMASEYLDLPLRTVNFTHEYKDRVFNLFLKEYAAGRTPNPDTLCNKEIKFKAFLEYALALGANRIATGHYAKIERTNGSINLLKGADKNKDQSYFLYMLNKHQLDKAIFPLGDVTKKDVRTIAKERGLPNYNRKDSTGVCFIGERDFKEFLLQYFKSNPGDIVTDDNKIVGRHDGLTFYTLGQRQGLGIGGGYDFKEEPWYVVNKDIENNKLIVVQGHDHPALFHKELIVNNLHWVSGKCPEKTELSAKIRYRQRDKKCIIIKCNKNELIVEFEEPQFAVTPGQATVFYDGDICLGGGTIKSRN
jgi:tRNA-specific 2-thiouridylase